MKNVFFLLFSLIGFSIVAQTTVSGVPLPQKENFRGETVVLNGAGVREKFWMDMYVGALYLDTASSDAQQIIAAEKPMAIKLHIVSGLITSKRMIDAVNEGFENSTNKNTSPISAEIDKFISFFSDDISKNDVFDIVYLPDSGVIVYKNGTEKGVIKGMDFKKALFGIWLSNKPADKDLKEAMLGKS
ncbi:MAG: chalcone isomerase family protein [Gillisia sp.]